MTPPWDMWWVIQSIAEMSTKTRSRIHVSLCFAVIFSLLLVAQLVFTVYMRHSLSALTMPLYTNSRPYCLKNCQCSCHGQGLDLWGQGHSSRDQGIKLWPPGASRLILPQPKSNLVHFGLKIWHLVATIFMIFVRINWPNFGEQYLKTLLYKCVY